MEEDNNLSNLIPKNNAGIYWIYDYKTDIVKNIKVVFCPTEKELEKDLLDDWYNKQEIRLKNYNRSCGAMCSDYLELDNEDLICYLLKIVLDKEFQDDGIRKKAFFEFGKIKEAKCFRDLFWYYYLSTEIPRSSLENSYYGWCFRDRPGGELDKYEN